MAVILNSSVRSVENYRYRIRKKMNVAPEETLFSVLSIFNFCQNPDFGRCFSAPARASCFEARNSFLVPQNTTCRVPVNTKIRPAGRIKCNKEKRLDAARVTS